LPDALWTVFSENSWALGVLVVGLAGVVAGPWAIIRAASRAKPTRDDDENRL
jgi:hypothetical protein